MLLKYLIDNLIQDEKYIDLSRRIAVLEEKILSGEEKPITTLSGKKLEVKR